MSGGIGMWKYADANCMLGITGALQMWSQKRHWRKKEAERAQESNNDKHVACCIKLTGCCLERTHTSKKCAALYTTVQTSGSLTLFSAEWSTHTLQSEHSRIAHQKPCIVAQTNVETRKRNSGKMLTSNFDCDRDDEQCLYVTLWFFICPWVALEMYAHKGHILLGNHAVSMIRKLRVKQQMEGSSVWGDAWWAPYQPQACTHDPPPRGRES